MTAIALAVALLLAGALLALATTRSARLSSAIGAASAAAACAIGLSGAVPALSAPAVPAVRWSASILNGSLIAGVDPLSAFFLVPIFVLGGLAAVYGRAYWLGARRHLGPAWFFFDLLLASLVLVVIARDALFFLVAWEVMSIAAYFLVTFDQESPEVRRAGWVYLIATHVGTAFLIPMFLLLSRPGGSFALESIRAHPPDAAIVLVLALVGFGVKAGVFPLNVWLPEAHAAAPSHVSAVMSGVLIKMGVYGMLRVTALVGPAPAWWGATLAAAGLLSGLVGVSLALYQRDLKRVLAYSSVENVGLVLLGLGVGMWGAARGDHTLAAFGLAGGLLHLWNHTLMKGAMFLSAGSVLHAAHTRDMEKLGGLAKRMPWTGAMMIAGAVAIAGLPPLNGFASEWLLYLALIGSGGVPALSVGVLSAIGALAALCFVRLIGVVLLGAPRGEAARHAHEPSPWMRGPIAVLLVLCALVAVFPGAVLEAIAPVAADPGGPFRASLADAQLAAAPLGTMAIRIAAGLALATALFGLLHRGRARSTSPTWGCGYTAPDARMQYTARSFSEVVAEHLVPRPLRPKVTASELAGPFPAAAAMSADASDPLTRGVYEPFLGRWAGRLTRIRWIQQGSLHLYLLYVVLGVIVAMAWRSLRGWVFP